MDAGRRVCRRLYSDKRRVTIMPKKSKTQSKPAPVPSDEPKVVLTRISPVGVHDGRMYYASDKGLIMTVSRLPYLALRSVIGNLEDTSSGVYAYVTANAEDHDAERVKADMTAHLEPAGKKCERAFRRLKEKGLYASTAAGLRKLMGDVLPTNLGWPMDVILDMNLGLSGLEEWDAEISDGTWLNAIELSVYLLHREAYMCSDDDSQWGLFVSRDVEFIWILAYLTTYGNALYMDMVGAKAEIDGAKMRIAQLALMSNTVEGLRSDLRAKDAEQERREAARSKELEELRTDNGRLSRENTKLKLRLELMEAGVAEAERESSQEPDVADLEFDGCQDVGSDYALVLPEDGVLFVGGHVRLQNKLKQLHPKWKFVTTRMSYSLLDDNLKARFVFLYTGHLSHKLFDKVRASLDCVPMAYVSSQNMARLHDEMLSAYNAYCEDVGCPEF